MTIRARVKTEPSSRWPVVREFNRRIKIAMDQAGIEIPFPQRSLNFGTAPLEIRLTQEAVPTRDPREEQNRTQAPVKPSLLRDAEEDEQT